MRGEDTLIDFDESYLNLIVAQLATNNMTVTDARPSRKVLWVRCGALSSNYGAWLTATR
jgi:hypothetical protein